MDVCCSFKSLVGGQCLAFDRRDRKQSMNIAPLLSCTKTITQHKSLDLVKSHCVTQCHGLEKIHGMLILQIRARFFRSPPTTETVSPFFPRLLAFFNRPQIPRQSPHFFPRSPAFFRSLPTTERVPPLFPRSSAFFARSQLPRESPFIFLARPLYRESPQRFFPRSPAFFVRPQLPRESPPFFPRSLAFSVRPQLPSESPLFFSSLARFFRPPPTTESLEQAK